MNSLRFDDMAALTGCGIDFATACAAPKRALRSARRSYPAGAWVRGVMTSLGSVCIGQGVGPSF